MGGVGPRVRSVVVVLALACCLLIGCVRAKPSRNNRSFVMVPQSQTTATAITPYPGNGTPSSAPVPSSTLTALMSTLVTPTTEVASTLAEPTMAPWPTDTPPLAATSEPVLAAPVAMATLLPSPTIIPTLVITQDTPYTVVPGDTLFSIATRYNTSVLAIMNRNALATATSISPGQTIIIPAGVGPNDPVPLGHVQHTVRANETLSQLGRRYRTTAAEIYRANQALIPDINHLKAGTVLSIMVGTVADMRTHRVRAGESLSSIARRYGLSVSALAQANGLSNPNRLYAGQVLVIPPPGSGGTGCTTCPGAS